MMADLNDRERQLGYDGIMARELANVNPDQTHDGSGASDTIRAAEIAPGDAESVLADDPNHDLSGLQLGSYQLIRRLGIGGMGHVYLAQHSVLGRRAAIKVLPQDGLKAEGKSSALERFRLESRAIASLDHPNIVRAHDFSQQGSIHYLVMEYVEGTDLEQLVIKHGPLAEDVAADFIRQAALGLSQIHAAGLVHRDIKPSNFLVDMSGVVKILDLGVVRYASADEASLTLKYKEQLLGTVDYLAPEQGLDSHRVDSRSDIYSLGCTLFYLLTGRPPFSDGTLAQRMLMHQLHDAPQVSETRQDISPAIGELVRRMLKKRANDRIQTASEVSSTLQAFLEERAARRAQSGSMSEARGPSALDDDAAELARQRAMLEQLQPPQQPQQPPAPAPTALAPRVADPGEIPLAPSQSQYNTVQASNDSTIEEPWNSPRMQRWQDDEPVTATAEGGYTPAFERPEYKRSAIRRLAAMIVLGTVCGVGAWLVVSQLAQLITFEVDPSEAGLVTDGHVTLKNSNGTKSAEGLLSGGKRTGHWIEWDPQGHKAAEGDYLNDLREGSWNFFRDGQVESSGSYRSGERHGSWVFRYKDGQKMKSGRFHNGKEDGSWTFWHPNGQKQSEGEFKDGEKTGVWKAWDQGGKPIEADAKPASA